MVDGGKEHWMAKQDGFLRIMSNKLYKNQVEKIDIFLCTCWEEGFSHSNVLSIDFVLMITITNKYN